MDDVVVRSATLLGALVLTAAASWILALPMGVVMVSAIAALVVGLVASFKRNTSPGLYVAYALLEGVVIGGISRVYEFAYSGIVIQAVLGVVLVFGAMLALYKTRIVRVTPLFGKVVLGAAIAFVALMLVNFLAGFVVDGGLGLRDGGPLAILFSVAGVVIGALFYALDFRAAEDLVRSGAPQKEAWRVGFGLTLTTVWVYLEVLRLLSYFRD
jgi:uncharacterized YccA/Bax inhibitor family protein